MEQEMAAFEADIAANVETESPDATRDRSAVGQQHPRYDEEVLDAVKQAYSEYGVDLFALAHSFAEGMSELEEQGGKRAYRGSLLRGAIAMEFIGEAKIEDARLEVSVQEAQATPAREVAFQVALDVLDERGLTPVVDALVTLTAVQPSSDVLFEHDDAKETAELEESARPRSEPPPARWAERTQDKDFATQREGGLAERDELLVRKRGRDAQLAATPRHLCVLGPRAGSSLGKTLTSTNLALALSQRGKRVALVDLDLMFGDVARYLGLAPEKTVYDLAQSPGALDWDKLQAFMAQRSFGVHTLIAPRRPEQASAVGAELLPRIYSILRENYDWVIVDTPPPTSSGVFEADVIKSIENSTDVVVVAMLDRLALLNTKPVLETLELMKYEGRIFLVVNNSQRLTRTGQSDPEVVLGRAPDVFVPFDKRIPQTVNEGVPIVVARPQSEAAEAFGRLADLLVGPVNGPAPAN